MAVAPASAHFVVNPRIVALTSAPEEVRAGEDENYCPHPGYGVFPEEIAAEGGPDGSTYLMGAQWEGVTRMAQQEDDMRDGYFIAARKEGPWRWVLWRCSWDDNWSAWSWSAAAATTWDTTDAAAAGREMVLRLWRSWEDQGAPSAVEGGLLDGQAGWALSSKAFRPKRPRAPKASPPPSALGVVDLDDIDALERSLFDRPVLPRRLG